MTVHPYQAVPQAVAAQVAYRPPQLAQGVSWLVHGASKSGKSELGDTTPAPRLVLDAEGGSRWTRSPKTVWEPAMSPPPAPDGTWESCLVYVRTHHDVLAAERWLRSGQHPFNSVVMDSVSEVQQRYMDSIAGSGQMQQKDWGELLREVSAMVRRFRDLIIHPTHPLWCVFLIAMTKEYKNTGRWRPLLQGAAQDYIPYYVDVCGYIWAEPNQTRHLITGPHPQFETGERVGGRLPYEITGNNRVPGMEGPDVSSMIQSILRG